MLYAQKFFKTKEKAQAFQKKHGGALYENVPGSRTIDDYRLEACLAELPAAEREAKPYCVAWNVVDEGPIKADGVEAWSWMQSRIATGANGSTGTRKTGAVTAAR